MSESLIRLLRGLGARAVRLETDSYLFHAGDVVRRLYAVETGEVRLLRRSQIGAPLILQRARAPALLAEASLFSERYHCDALAVAPSMLLTIDKSALRSALASDSRLGEALHRHLAGEVQAARMHAEIVSLRTVAERLDAWLSMRGAKLPPKGDWKSLAAEIAVSPEALYREIARRGKPQA